MGARVLLVERVESQPMRPACDTLSVAGALWVGCVWVQLVCQASWGRVGVSTVW